MLNDKYETQRLKQHADYSFDAQGSHRGLCVFDDRAKQEVGNCD